MRYTSKFQSKAQALGSLHTFDLVSNWLLEAMAPALGSLETLPLKHLKTNKVAETDARPRQNGNYFTKLTPNDVNRQPPACHYVFFFPRSSTKSFYCFGLNAGARGIQPGLAIFPIHISIDYPELASWKHLC